MGEHNTKEIPKLFLIFFIKLAAHELTLLMYSFTTMCKTDEQDLIYNKWRYYQSSFIQQHFRISCRIPMSVVENHFSDLCQLIFFTLASVNALCICKVTEDPSFLKLMLTCCYLSSVQHQRFHLCLCLSVENKRDQDCGIQYVIDTKTNGNKEYAGVWGLMCSC